VLLLKYSDAEKNTNDEFTSDLEKCRTPCVSAQWLRGSPSANNQTFCLFVFR